MEAIIQVCGKQFPVKKGQKIVVDRIEAETGSELKLEVLACYSDDTIKIGQPLVAGAQALAKVVNHKRGDKIVVSTFKRRKGYHKTRGHRQDLTEIEITDIQVG